MQLVEERAPNGFVRIEDVISQYELDSIASSFAVAAGLDVETVNSGLVLRAPRAKRRHMKLPASDLSNSRRAAIECRCPLMGRRRGALCSIRIRKSRHAFTQA